MSLWVKTNRFIKAIFPKYVWTIPNNEKKVYLTFDDGPIPEITEWVLNQLNQHKAKATFFCIGDNIQKHPEIFQKIIENDHSIGNHTFNHLKGWDTSLTAYIENTEKCAEIMTNSPYTVIHNAVVNDTSVTVSYNAGTADTPVTIDIAKGSSAPFYYRYRTTANISYLGASGVAVSQIPDIARGALS